MLELSANRFEFAGWAMTSRRASASSSSSRAQQAHRHKLHHDQFSKDLLEKVLYPLGKVETNRELRIQPRFIDAVFEARSEFSPAQRDVYGLPGRLVSSLALFEPYRRPLELEHIWNGYAKLSYVWLFRQRAQQNARRKARPSEPPLEPCPLWIITPSASADLLQTVGLKPAWKVWGQTLSPQWWEQHVWPQGVYLAAQQIPLGVVVLNELPEVRQTLTLRLMAKGQTLERAVTQLRALPEDDPLRDPVMNLLRSWAIIKDHPSELDPDEEEALMKIQYISYEDWKKELLQAGRLEGEQKGRLEGEQKGRLHQLEALLGLPLSSEELLASLPPTLVLERIQQLELRLRAMLHTPAA